MHDVDEVIGAQRLGYFLQLVPGWIQLTAEFRYPSWHWEDYRGYLMARLGCFFLKDRGAGRATCRVPKIDVRHIAAWQAVSRSTMPSQADQELTDAGLVVACAGFDD